jgi:hypothetical protein
MSQPSDLPPEDRLSKEQEMWAGAVDNVRRRARRTRWLLLIVAATTGFQVSNFITHEEWWWWLRVVLLVSNIVCLAAVSFLYGQGTMMLRQMEHSVVVPRFSWEPDDDD